MFQGNFMGVKKKDEECSVHRDLQGGLKGYLKEVQRELQGSFRVASKTLRGVVKKTQYI